MAVLAVALIEHKRIRYWYSGSQSFFTYSDADNSLFRNYESGTKNIDVLTINTSARFDASFGANPDL